MNLDQRFKDLAQKGKQKSNASFFPTDRRYSGKLAAQTTAAPSDLAKARRCGSSATGHCHFAAQS